MIHQFQNPAGHLAVKAKAAASQGSFLSAVHTISVSVLY